MGALKAGCDRAREWVSLELDAELSELEHALLRRHLARCPRCAASARAARAATGALRAASLERPTLVVTLPRRPRERRLAGRRTIQLCTAAAAVAAAVGLGTLAGSLTSSPHAVRASAASIAATQEPYFEQRLLAMVRAHKTIRS
jgi:anti-sigma factor RsiW